MSRTVNTGAITSFGPFDRMTMIRETLRCVMSDKNGPDAQASARERGEDTAPMTGIARFEVGRFDYDLVGEFKFFKSPVPPSIVVRLTDDNGVQGWGQSVPIATWT